MRKFLPTFILAAMMFVAMPSQAQFKFGVRAGANLVNMSLSDGLDNLKGNNRAGFYAGPTVKFTLPIVGLAIDASAVYDQRTTELSDGVNTERITARAINIPINARYGIGIGSLAEVFAFAGPQFGFNVSKDKYFGAADWTWKSSNFSVNVGIGCTVMSHLEFKANYNIACGKTAEITPKDAATAAIKSFGKPKYNSWQFGLAYYF